MANKKLLTTLGIAGTVVLGGGGIYAYNFYNDPLTKIAVAESDFTEDIEEYLEQRLAEDLKWHKDNKENDKTLDVLVAPLVTKVHMYHNPKDNKGQLSVETSLPGEKLDVTLSDKDENNITLESSSVDFGIIIPQQFIKDTLKNEVPEYEQVTGIELSSLDMSINELVKLFFNFDKEDQKLSKSEKLDILKALPKEATKKENGKYILTLNKGNISILLSKYEEVIKPKLKTEFEKNYISKNIETLKSEVNKNLKNDIVVEYTFNGDEVFRVISTKDKSKDYKVEIKTKVSKDSVEISLKDLTNDKNSVTLVSKKLADKTYQDTFDVRNVRSSNSFKLTGNTKHENGKTVTTFEDENGDSTILTTEIKDNKLQYILTVINDKVLAVTYDANVEKPAESSKEWKDLAGKSKEDQELILAEFISKLLKFTAENDEE